MFDIYKMIMPHILLQKFSVMYQRFVYIMIEWLYDITSADKRHFDFASSTPEADQFVICRHKAWWS